MSTVLRHTELFHGGAADADAVERVMAAAFDPQFGEAWTRSQFVGAMAMPGVALTLARVDGVVVGFTLVRTILDEAELLLLAVTPSVRRRGIGGGLMRAFVAEARGRGVARLHLEVRAGNSAIHLYRTAGFAKVGERRSYYRGAGARAHDAHSYAMDLGG